MHTLFHQTYNRVIKKDTFLIFLIFVLSRFIYSIYFNLNFDSQTIDYYWQYLDPKLLREDLLRSIFYLHQQPPLFNLYLGLVLKLFPINYAIAFQLSFHLLGLFFSLYLFQLMKQIGVKRYIALGLAVIFIVSPTTLIYESWLFYSYPAAFLLCASAYYLVVFLRYRKWKDVFGFYFMLTILILTRATFRVEILCFFFLVLLVLCKNDRKIILQTFILPFIILTLYSIKQYVIFDKIHPSTSYLGRNIPSRVVKFLSKEERDNLSKLNVLPSFFFHSPHYEISRYSSEMLLTKTGIPALDQEFKSTGKKNFNHLGYLEISDSFMDGFFEVMKHYPMAYLKSFIITKKYFYPASKDFHARKANENNFVSILSDHYDRLFLLKADSSDISWALLFGLPILIIFGSIKALYVYIKDPHNLICWLTLCFIIFNILYVTVITAGVSTDDFNRYRFEIDFLYLTLLGILISNIFDVLKKYKNYFRKFFDNQRSMNVAINY